MTVEYVHRGVFSKDWDNPLSLSDQLKDRGPHPDELLRGAAA